MMSKNDPEFYFGIKDESIIKGGVFERFSELIPAVGEHIIGEKTENTIR